VAAPSSDEGSWLLHAAVFVYLLEGIEVLLFIGLTSGMCKGEAEQSGSTSENAGHGLD